MVSGRLWLHVGCVLTLLCSVTFGGFSIESVRLVSDDPVHIKPYQSVFVVLDVVVAVSSQQEKIRHAPAQLAKRTIINDREYTGRQRAVNAVVGFELNKPSIRLHGDLGKAFQVVGLLFWDAEDKEYLFSEPGVYQVELYPGVALKVVVEEPTVEEARAAAEIRSLGVEFAFFLIEPSGGKAVGFASRAEELLEEYGKTAYARQLSIAAGIVRLRKARGQGPAAGEFDWKKWALEMRALAEEYFGPYVSESIRSFLEARAANQLAQTELNLLRDDPELPEKEAAAVKRRAIALLEKVRDSPYSLGRTQSAVDKLSELERGDSVPAKPSGD